MDQRVSQGSRKRAAQANPNPITAKTPTFHDAAGNVIETQEHKRDFREP
jgi:hypothetical protein